MKILFIGGTGLISTASTQLAIERGHDLYLLHRGHSETPAAAKSLIGDINKDPGGVAALLDEHQFDAVVNWIVFTPQQLQRDIELFSGKTKQYMLISSASAYQKPCLDYLIREDTPLCNPYWEYSRNKIATEEILLKAYRESGFPGTIVRPSLTYGDTQIPLVVNSWAKPYTIIQRMKANKPIIVPGDGNSLWTCTHNSDFAKGLVGLLGHTQSIGQAFHITSDEVLTWNQYYEIVGEAIGVKPKLVHIASDFIAACLPGTRGGLLGDKAVSTVFDNSKIKRYVPGFVATTSFREGIRQTLDWFEADPARQEIDAELDTQWDKLVAAYEDGLKQATSIFNQ